MTESANPWGSFYATLTPLSIALSFMPPFAVGKGLNARSESFGSVWEMASRPAGTPARLAVILLVVMWGCLLAAALWPTVLTLPLINAGCASILGLLLVIRPATGSPPPDLSFVGQAQLVVAAAVVVVSLLHLGVLRRCRAARVPPARTVKG